MLLIKLEILVKATCKLTTVTACSQRAPSMLLIYAGSVSKSDLLVDESLGLMLKEYMYFHATYSAGSISEVNLSVDDSHRQHVASALVELF